MNMKFTEKEGLRTKEGGRETWSGRGEAGRQAEKQTDGVEKSGF